VYATDLCESSDAGLEAALALAYGAGAQLTVMHCVYYRDRMWWAPSAIPDFDNLRTKFLAEMRQKGRYRGLARRNAGDPDRVSCR
jgi:hypothetical protein